MGELEALNVIYDEYKDKGINVLGIALDDVENFGDEGIKKVIEVLELDFPNVITDRDYIGELVKFVTGTPTAVVVGKDGEFLMDLIVGSGGKDRDIQRFKEIIEELQNK